MAGGAPTTQVPRTHVSGRRRGLHGCHPVRPTRGPSAHAGSAMRNGHPSCTRCVPQRGLYRAPGRARWEERSQDWAIAGIGRLMKRARDADFKLANEQGLRVNRWESVARSGGATLDGAENSLILKLWRALGIAYITNQARI